MEFREGDDVRGSDTRTNEDFGSRGRKSNLKDPQSTGRKVAAKRYPLNREQACEWRGRANCGGGLRPIAGCASGLQQARHHGPEKDVSNNESGNVHRICHYCHNRWHAKNDPVYDWNDPNTTPHSPRPLTESEYADVVLDEMRYLGTKKLVKVVED